MTDQGHISDNSKLTAGSASTAAESNARRLVGALNRLTPDPEYVLGALADKVESMKPISKDRLTKSDREFLVESGAFSEQELSRVEAEVDRGSLLLATIQGWLLNLLDTLSLDEVVGFLDKDDSAVRRDVANGYLLAVEVSGQLRFPRWQFSLGSPDKRLPGLTSIIKATTARDWRSVASFMSTPQQDLAGEGRNTPAEWLRGGGEVTAVTNIVESWDIA